MIVISGALVAVATVLLVVGLASTGLTFVYASIAVSVLAFAALVAGVLQRRNEDVDVATGAAPEPVAAAPVEGVSAVYRTAGRAADRTDGVTVLADAAAAPAEGDVLVVPGRPRYHVSGCRYLADKDVESLPVADARSEGFTACGVCRPDASLTAAAGASAGAGATSAADVDEPVDSGVPGADLEEDAGAPVVPDAPAPAPVRRSAVATAAATRRATTAARSRTATAGTGGRVTAEPAAVARKAAPVAKAPAAAAKSGKVVVIPERGKFHRGECRYVRGAEGTQEMTATQAKRQGFQACGVCKP